MKRTLVLVCVFLSLFATLLAQTNVSGNVNGVWNTGGSPYIVDGDIQVIVGDELQINPGVVVQFSGSYLFHVYGRLLAEGTDGNEITFTSSVPATGWRGLRFVDNDTNGQAASTLEYCNFEYGIATGVGSELQGGAIYCYYSSELTISNCSIENSQATTGGAIFLENSDIVIEDTIIDGNTATGAGGGIYLRNSSPVIVDVQVLNNTAFYDGGGINCFNSSPSFNHVLIADNYTQREGGGISLYNYSNPHLLNVTLSNNLADDDGCGIAVLYHSTATLLNSIVWENDSREIYVSSTSSMTVNYSDILGGQNGINLATGASLNWGTGNINDNPMFIDPANGDYNISATSPCIDAGDPNPIYNDPDGSRNDMGAFYFYQTGIKGQVSFSASGSGNIEDVLITVTGTESTTTYPGPNGFYYAAVGAGTYTVTATLSGFTANPISYTGVVVLDDQLVSNIDFVMTPLLPGQIVGTVVVNGIGSELDVVITANGVSTSPYYVDDPGYYEYTLVIATGIYDVTASLEGYTDSTYTGVVVQPNLATTGIDFELNPILYQGWISGTVTLSGGAGNVEDVIVSADTASTSPDATGFYELLLTNGNFDVHATLDGYAPFTYYNVEVIANETTTDIDMTLLPWQIISGTNYLMTVYVTATLDGQFVTGTGSNQLGAFGPGGLADCRGIAVWVDGNHPLWNQNYHYWPLPGYWYINVVGNSMGPGAEDIEFRLYETTTDAVYLCYEVIDYEDNTIQQMNQTYPSTVETQEFALNQNWNWISFNLHPADNATDVIFNPLIAVPDIYQVKHEGFSHTYFPGWLGDYPNVSDGDGLLVDMLNDVDPFEVDGEKINPVITPLDLVTGWNWIAFLPENSQAVGYALESIQSSVVMVKNQTQSATYTGNWVGDLNSMRPGVGYKILLTSDATLTYPGTGAYGTDEVQHVNKLQPEQWSLLNGTESNMVVMADLQLEEDEYLNPERYAVGIFDQKGNCRSVGVYENNFWYFTVVGNEEADKLYFSVFDTVTGEERQSFETFDYTIDGILGTPTEPISIKFNSGSSEIPSVFSLNQNHPNPFNPSTSISYSLPNDQMVRLSIYNIKGQHLLDLVNEHQQAGVHHVTWDAADYSSGIYFYKIVSGNDSQIRKCLLIK